MYYKTFEKLDFHTKKEILSELGYLYDLTTERGLNSLKKEFKYIEPQIQEVMIEKGLYTMDLKEIRKRIEKLNLDNVFNSNLCY